MGLQFIHKGQVLALKTVVEVYSENEVFTTEAGCSKFQQEIMQLGHFTPSMYESGKGDNALNFPSAENHIGSANTSKHLIVFWPSQH